MKIYLTAILFLLAGSLCYSQMVEGFVKDLKTNEALAYVHIGILYKNFGVISTENGSFKIDLSSAQPNDVLMFSMIGYDPYRIEVGAIKEKELNILLTPRAIDLGEVIVKPKKVKLVNLGRTKPSKTTTGQSGHKEFGFGAERGLQVIVPEGKKFRVLDARFHLRFNTVDSVLFRVNVYSMRNGLPDESLLKKDAFVTSKKNNHWIICDLENQNLTINTHVVVTYEVVRWWFNNGDNQIFLTHGDGYKEGGIFYRLSSQDRWRTEGSSGSFPITMYLTTEEVK